MHDIYNAIRKNYKTHLIKYKLKIYEHIQTAIITMTSITAIYKIK